MHHRHLCFQKRAERLDFSGTSNSCLANILFLLSGSGLDPACPVLLTTQMLPRVVHSTRQLFNEGMYPEWLVYVWAQAHQAISTEKKPRL